MSFRQRYHFLLLVGWQLCAVGFLFWATGAILPVVFQTLFRGMLVWTAVGIGYCWVFQLLGILVTLSIRRFLVPLVLDSMKAFPVFYLRILWCCLAMGISALWWRLFEELTMASTLFGWRVMVEWLLIMSQYYLLTSLAAPLCSAEGYRFVFKGIDLSKPQPPHNHLSVVPAATALPRQPSRGYPGWIWPIVWFLFWVLMDWMGCEG